MRVPSYMVEFLEKRPEFIKREKNIFVFEEKGETYEIVYKGDYNPDFPITWNGAVYKAENVPFWFKGLYLETTEFYYKNQSMKNLISDNKKRTIKNVYYCYAFAMGDHHLFRRASNYTNEKRFYFNKIHTAFIVNFISALKKSGYEVVSKHSKTESMIEVFV